jgi:3',5'-cyclic AMP phosphodiesterase CpdA
MTARTVYKIAHISDLHLDFDAIPHWRDLMNKRAIGYYNWRYRRRHHHKRQILELLIADLNAQKPDHTIVSGDLVNLALPGEFQNAADFLSKLDRPSNVSVVPGNHDAYVSMPVEKSIGLWREYMRGDTSIHARFGGSEISFPYVRIRKKIAIIGLSSAIPTPPFMAYGNLGRSQVKRLGTILRQLAKDDLFRIVVVHHPPISASAARWNRLLDGKALQEVLQGDGAELVLHGHLHQRSIRYLEGENGITPIVGVPSASLAYQANRPGAAYHLYSIDGTGKSSTLKITTRTLKTTGHGFSDAAFTESSAV